jgi:hypothetical protein
MTALALLLALSWHAVHVVAWWAAVAMILFVVGYLIVRAIQEMSAEYRAGVIAALLFLATIIFVLFCPPAHSAPIHDLAIGPTARAYRSVSGYPPPIGECGYYTNWRGDSLYVGCIGADSIFRIKTSVRAENVNPKLDLIPPTTLRWTAPYYETMTLPNGLGGDVIDPFGRPGTLPETGPITCEVWYVARMNPWTPGPAWIPQRVPVRVATFAGLTPGQPMSWTETLDYGTCYVESVDAAGNRQRVGNYCSSRVP